MNTNDQLLQNKTASVFRSIGASNHALESREPNDFYATPPAAIDGLLRKFALPKDGVVWECACGQGHLAQRLTEKGFNVYASDLIDRNYGVSGIDFLKQTSAPDNCNVILTNPPYKHGTDFILHSLDLLPVGGVVAMFLKTTFLEGKERKERLYDAFPPLCILQFSERVPCAKNGQFDMYPSSSIAYAWYIWEKGFNGKTTIDWIGGKNVANNRKKQG